MQLLETTACTEVDLASNKNRSYACVIDSRLDYNSEVQLVSHLLFYINY